MIEYIVGDVREQPFHYIRLIPHCCNDIGVMGSGVAKALCDKWPKVKEDYLAFGKLNGYELGAINKVQVEERTWVINMIGQHDVMVDKDSRGRAIGKDGLPPVRYEALIDAMKSLRKSIHAWQSATDMPVEIHCPKFGCDLAGGSWACVSELIEEFWARHCRVLCCVIDESQLP